MKQLSGIDYTNKFKDLVWTSNINQELPIKMTSKYGPGSEMPITLSQLFLQKVAELKDKVCMQAIREKFADG